MVTNEELRAALEPLAVKMSRARNTLLFRRGDAPSGIFLIYSGIVKLGLDELDGALPSRMLGPGGLVGLPATMSGDPYSLSAEVTQDAELGFVSRKAFLHLLRQNAALSFLVIQMLSEEIQGIRGVFRRISLPEEPARSHKHLAH